MTASVAELARQHAVSEEAVRVLQDALRRGGGHQAQFNHPELGGMGQWSAGGMTQIGDMANASLKGTVAALCAALAGGGTGADRPGAGAEGASSPSRSDWWPGDLGRPAASGAQNGMRYAYFPQARRIAVEQAGTVSVYDSGDNRITGVSQQQSGTQDLSFSSAGGGTVRTTDLRPVA